MLVLITGSRLPLLSAGYPSSGYSPASRGERSPLTKTANLTDLVEPTSRLKRCYAWADSRHNERTNSC
jgi:hypothetical protein